MNHQGESAWLTFALLIAMRLRRKDELVLQLERDPSVRNTCTYMSYRNRLTKLIREAKILHHCPVFAQLKE